jgi:hypothetical protein
MKTSSSRDRLGLLHCGISLLLASAACGQVPDSPSPAPAGGGGGAAAPAAQPAAQGGASGGQKGGSFLGKDVPAFDPGSEILTWDGKNWNINNNRLFEARFEKYLNAPEETTANDRQYQTVISNILTLLAPGNATTKNIDAAFALLPRGSGFDIDARLCDSLADAVYSSWRAQNAQNRLEAANQSLEMERKQEYWNAEHISAGENARENSSSGMSGHSSKNAGSQKTPSTSEVFEDTSRATEQTKRIAEIEGQIKANQVKRELNSIQAKVEFQALILQFFLQRRFLHVLMATRFYRAVFDDGDTKLNVGKDTKDLFEKSSGLPPTVATIDSLANEALRDVREGVQAYNFLLEKGELASATKRLGESFVEGEFVPEIRTLPRDKKRQALEFAHKSNELISALDVKDYTLAEQLVNELTKMAKDFDSSKPMAAIETSKRVSEMHLAKARNAALRGDNTTLEAELTAATELWPRNPALAELSNKIFSQGDVQQKAVIDFEQLLSQKNYRQIYEDSPRFIGALAFYPDKQAKLKEVLDNMKIIEEALMRSDEMVRQNNYPGAWESVEKIAQQFPDDTKLSKTRADLTPHAADFVRTLQDAQDMEKRDQVGASLAYYLKAKKLYPASDFANGGITRLVKKIVPDT